MGYVQQISTQVSLCAVLLVTLSCAATSPTSLSTDLNMSTADHNTLSQTIISMSTAEATSGQPSITDTTSGQPSITDTTTGQPSTTEATTGQSSTTEATSGQATTTEATSGQPSITDTTSSQPSITDTTTGQPSITAATGGQATTTEATSSQPSITDTTSSQPSSTEATSGQPSITDTTTDQPSITDTTSGQPGITDTTSSQPSTTEATTGQPSITDTTTDQPSITDTTSGQPGITDTTSSQPSTTDTTTDQPSITDTTSGQPGITDTTSSQPSTTEATTGQPSITDTTTDQPSITDTTSGQPGITDTTSSQPSTTDTTTDQPSITDTTSGQPGITDTTSSQPSTTEATTGQPSITDTTTDQPSITDTTSSHPTTTDAASGQPTTIYTSGVVSIDPTTHSETMTSQATTPMRTTKEATTFANVIGPIPEDEDPSYDDPPEKTYKYDMGVTTDLGTEQEFIEDFKKTICPKYDLEEGAMIDCLVTSTDWDSQAAKSRTRRDNLRALAREVVAQYDVIYDAESETAKLEAEEVYSSTGISEEIENGTLSDSFVVVSEPCTDQSETCEADPVDWCATAVCDDDMEKVDTGESCVCQSKCKHDYCQNEGACEHTDSGVTCRCLADDNRMYVGAQCQTLLYKNTVILVISLCLAAVFILVLLLFVLFAKKGRDAFKTPKQWKMRGEMKRYPPRSRSETSLSAYINDSFQYLENEVASSTSDTTSEHDTRSIDDDVWVSNGGPYVKEKWNDPWEAAYEAAWRSGSSRPPPKKPTKTHVQKPKDAHGASKYNKSQNASKKKKDRQASRKTEHKSQKSKIEDDRHDWKKYYPFGTTERRKLQFASQLESDDYMGHDGPIFVDLQRTRPVSSMYGYPTHSSLDDINMPEHHF